jgi:hypothetical protein
MDTETPETIPVKKPRKSRSDKGQKRGPYKPRVKSEIKKVGE